MPEYVRVKAKDTKHELSIVASAFDPEAYDEIDKAATNADGTPLPPKHHQSLSGQGRKATNSGQSAESKKETAS